MNHKKEYSSCSLTGILHAATVVLLPQTPTAGQENVFHFDTASGGMEVVLGFEFSATLGVCLFYSTQSEESGEKIVLNQFNQFHII